MSRTRIALGDALAELIDHRGKTPKKLGGDWTAGGHRVVSALNIKGSRVDNNEHHYISDEMYQRWMKVPLAAGDVLLTSEAPTGEVAFLGEDQDWALGQRVFGLRGKPDLLDGRYLFYALRGGDARHQLMSRATGTTVSGIRQSELVKVELDLPPLDEQRSVAATLGALDEKIESNRLVIDFVQRLLDSLSEALAGDCASLVPLGELASHSRETINPNVLGEARVDHFSIPAFDAGAWPERVSASSIRSQKLNVGKPSILVSRLNPRINRTWWSVPIEGVPAMASTEFLILSTDDPADLGALWLAVRGEYFVNELKRRVTGTSGSHQRIRPDDALSIEVPDVRKLLRDDKSKADFLLALTHQRRSECRDLIRLRDSLIPELLSGRIEATGAGEAIEVEA